MKKTAFASFVFISLFFYSCASDSFQIGTTMKVENPSIIEIPEIEIEGDIGLNDRKMKFKETDLRISGFTYIHHAFDTKLTFLNPYSTEGAVFHGDRKNNVKFTYWFDEKLFYHGIFAETHDYSGSRGNFSNIRIKRMPKRFKFKTIDPILLVNIGSAIDNTKVTGEDLPATFARFSIGDNVFDVLVSKIAGNSASSMRSLIRDEEQEYLIVAENGILAASFSPVRYAVYRQDMASSEDLMSVIGVYLGLFRLLNKY